MKKKIIIISVVVVIIVSVTLLILFNKNSKTYSKEIQELIDTKVERGDLLAITYSKNLGEDIIDSIEINVSTIKMVRYKGNKDKLDVEEYIISESDLDDIKDYINEYNLPAWTNIPVDNIDLINEDSESIVLIFNNEKINGTPYEYYVLDINNGVKKEYRDYLIKFKNKIESLVKKENLLISYGDDNNNQVEE